MKNFNLLTGMVICLLVGMMAGQATASTKEELKERFKQRYSTIQKIKDAGKIGEVYTGFIEALANSFLDDKVDPDNPESQTIGDLIAAENADRNQLYHILARETGTEAESVGRRNAVREFEKAKPDHYLKPAKSGWVKKKDLKSDE